MMHEIQRRLESEVKCAITLDGIQRSEEVPAMVLKCVQIVGLQKLKVPEGP